MEEDKPYIGICNLFDSIGILVQACVLKVVTIITPLVIPFCLFVRLHSHA